MDDLRANKVVGLKVGVFLFDTVEEFDFFAVHEVIGVKGLLGVDDGTPDKSKGSGDPVLRVIFEVKGVFGVKVGGVGVEGFDDGVYEGEVVKTG